MGKHNAKQWNNSTTIQERRERERDRRREIKEKDGLAAWKKKQKNVNCTNIRKSAIFFHLKEIRETNGIQNIATDIRRGML